MIRTEVICEVKPASFNTKQRTHYAIILTIPDTRFLGTEKTAGLIAELMQSGAAHVGASRNNDHHYQKLDFEVLKTELPRFLSAMKGTYPKAQVTYVKNPLTQP